MFRPLLTCPTYHHVGDVVPSAAANLGVSTQIETFEAHLDYYEAAYDIVDLETLLYRPWPGRPLLLTFDDSYRSLAETVAPILLRRGLPGVVFLNPDMIERPTLQFDHALGELATRVGVAKLLSAIGPEAVAAGGLSAYINGPAVELLLGQRLQLQQRLLTVFGLDEAVLHTDLNLYLRPGDVQDLAAAGLEIANHTASHVRCRSLSADDMAHEITGSKHRLAALSGRPVRAFSVPYGSRHDVTPDLLTVLKNSGHEVVFFADGRLSAAGSAGLLAWDRVPMDGVRADRLALNLALRPRLRGVKDRARCWARAAVATPAIHAAVNVITQLPA